MPYGDFSEDLPCLIPSLHDRDHFGAAELYPSTAAVWASEVAHIGRDPARLHSNQETLQFGVPNLVRLRSGLQALQGSASEFCAHQRLQFRKSTVSPAGMYRSKHRMTTAVAKKRLNTR